MSKARFIETANYIYPSTSCLPNIVFEQAVVGASLDAYQARLKKDDVGGERTRTRNVVQFHSQPPCEGVNLRYVVHQRWPVRDSIDNCPHVATGTFSITYRTSELSLENRVMASARLVRLTPESRHS